MTRLDEAAWPSVPMEPLLLVPLGSTEQHGPHLPFSVDTDIAAAVAREAAERLGAVVAPALAYGSSGEHQGFAGTLSIGQDALRLLLVELVRSARTWAARVVLIAGHGGNAPVLWTVDGINFASVPTTPTPTLKFRGRGGACSVSTLGCWKFPKRVWPYSWPLRNCFRQLSGSH